eukprot:CAMPEP_0181182870 /NCGR_PEP_ID=MMETSP1096-20121128/8116_1 /TAXON_ID=156174 ORGANISM="Chrysochromulina ericina, Strain CCMP281" /NCGR_SAMPLE_ID=MMETSP1096 /ASSEMBLY_ACC=CAM_ASM_000453 /LENGTH=71 /DNA_ID=CAMNT_0023271499 /DNA_START=1149 /DNA_END=1361 /DNA_ORIENTATION=-
MGYVGTWCAVGAAVAFMAANGAAGVLVSVASGPWIKRRSRAAASSSTAARSTFVDGRTGAAAAGCMSHRDA